MEIQAYTTVQRVYDLIKQDRPLTDKERSYLVGTLETLLGMYREAEESPEPAHRSFLDRLKP